MASEIKVDTISEKTSAGGVTIDGLLIKDGGISGDVSLIGTTPTFTIGDAGAEDATLLFDGNAKDFYIALDDSADKLVIGEGSTVGTNSILTITDDSVTVGDASAVDTKIVFDGNALDFRIGIDDGTDTLEIGKGSAHGTTTHMTFDTNGIISMPLQASASVNLSGNQSISDSTVTKVTHDTEVYDINGDFASNKFTCPVDGIYLMIGTASMSLADADNLTTYLFVNGADVSRDSGSAAMTEHHNQSTVFNSRLD